MTHQLPPQKNYDTVDKVEKSRKNVNEKVNASITSTKNKIEIVKKTEKSQKFPESVFTSKNKKNDTVDKSDKYRSIKVTNVSNQSTQIENPSKIDIQRDNLSVSFLNGKVPPQE